MPAIPAWEAVLIYPLAHAISDRVHKIDPDLAFMCSYGEMPLGTILLDVICCGIAGDGARAEAAYAEIGDRSRSQCQKLTGSEKVNPWQDPEVSELLRQHDLASRLPRDGAGVPLRLRLFRACTMCPSLPAVSFHKSPFPDSSAAHSG